MNERVLLTIASLPNPNQGGPSRIVLEMLKTRLHVSQPQVQLFGLFKKHLVGNYEDALSLCDETPDLLTPPRAASEAKRRLVRLVPNLVFYSEVRLRHLTVRNLEKAVQTIHPHVIHAHGALTAYGASNRFSDIPLVFTSHHKGSVVTETVIARNPHFRGTLIEKAWRQRECEGFRRASVVTFPSFGARTLLESEYPDVLKGQDVRVVYNGIDLSYIAEVRVNEDVMKRHDLVGRELLVCVANYVPEKGHVFLLDSLAQLKGTMRQNLRVLLVGTGPLEKAINGMILERGLEDVVQITGVLPHKEVIQLLKLSRACVAPSLVAVFDLALLEAMATRTPIIASSVGGNLEMLDETSALLVPSRSTTQLSDAIERVLGHSSEIEHKVAKARKRVEDCFSLGAMINQYLSLYAEFF
jgi:glycosyltransferase involved in cell wall biosynthesis